MALNLRALLPILNNIAKTVDMNLVRCATPLLMSKLSLPSSVGPLKSANAFHTSLPRRRGEDRKQLAASMPKRDDGAAGERSIDVDSMLQSKDDFFPDLDLPNRLFDGVPFKEIPIVHIRTTKNNTILTVSDYKGVTKMIHSCGKEGFKNARKGTNVAAQATAITFTNQMIADGYKNVRVKVRGLGPGRISAIKGLQMGGLNIISLTDNTRCSINCPRPRKQRRL